MYCTLCGAVLQDTRNYCPECGSSLLVPGIPGQAGTAAVERPAPSGVIFISWCMLLISFIPMAFINIPIYFLVLMSSIFLLTSRCRSAISNGRILLILWALSVFVGFSVGDLRYLIGVF
jgi:hypothetical protein